MSTRGFKQLLWLSLSLSQTPSSPQCLISRPPSAKSTQLWHTSTRQMTLWPTYMPVWSSRRHINVSPCRWRCEAAVNPTKSVITLAGSRKGKWGKEGKGQRNHSEQESPFAGLPKRSECKSSPNVAQAPHRCTPSSTAHSLFRNIKANEGAVGASIRAGHVAQKRGHLSNTVWNTVWLGVVNFSWRC